METKIVLLTGASSGIGKATAERLMRNAAIVYGASRSANEELEIDEISGGRIIHTRMDVNNELEIQTVVETIISQHGRLDVVICNAGNGLAGSIEDSDSEEVKYQFETNFFGVVKTIQACLPIFRAQSNGRIISISSVAAVIPIPYQAFYSSVKSASHIFMQALAIEMKDYNVACCSILPGDTKTGFTAARKYASKANSTSSPYYKSMKKAVGKMEEDELKGMSADIIAKSIEKQIYRKRMKALVIPGFIYKTAYILSLLLPIKLKIWAISKLY
jgi:NAD(P)-dependent dehydrogenase (short-subunit alcohol dehydrogenase family)